MLAPTGLGTVYYAYVHCIPTIPRLHGLKRWFSILVAVNVVNILTFLVRAPSDSYTVSGQADDDLCLGHSCKFGRFCIRREAEARILLSRTLL